MNRGYPSSIKPRPTSALTSKPSAPKAPEPRVQAPAKASSPVKE